MTPAFRNLALRTAAVAVAAFGAAAVASYQPGGATDRARALESLGRTLAFLSDEELDSTARLRAYRDGLSATDALLRRALRSNPSDTSSIERLATVRWESGVLAGDPDSDSALSLVNIAAARAPRVPEIHLELGGLLYKMGNPDAAAPFMKRATTLSPAMTGRVVATMQDAGIEPDQIVSTLTWTAELVLALRDGFTRSGRLSEWLLSAEELLPEYPRQLLPSYASACWKAKESDRLLAHAERLGVLPEREAEAERQLAIGWAQVGRSAPELAALAAKTGRGLAEGNPELLERAGQVALAAGDPAEAELAFRDALGAFARGRGRGTDRARCYRERGQALERLGRVEDAFDQYRRALEILPDDPWLRKRFEDSSPIPPSESRR